MNPDQLRTVLANERTLLAYIRTALSAWIFGMGTLKFFSENLFLNCLGWGVTAFGTIILVYGVWQFKGRYKITDKPEEYR